MTASSQSTLSTNDVPTLHVALESFIESASILASLRLSILDMDRRGQVTGSAAAHYEQVRTSLIAQLEAASLPSAEDRRKALATPAIFASWSRSAAATWSYTLRVVSERLRAAVDRSTSA